jgi:AcrR family transcriptional regulator
VGESVADERARIMQAAWTVLERADFEGFKVQLVMREADLSARAFYREFADKDELLLALMLDEMDRAAPRLRAAVERADDPADRVAAWIGAVLGAAGDPRRFARARLFSSLPEILRRYPSEVDEGSQQLRAPLQEAIVAGRDAGMFPWADPDGDALLVYALTGNSLANSLNEAAHRSVDGVVADVVGFVLRALGFPRGAEGGGVGER